MKSQVKLLKMYIIFVSVKASLSFLDYFCCCLNRMTSYCDVIVIFLIFRKSSFITEKSSFINKRKRRFSFFKNRPLSNPGHIQCNLVHSVVTVPSYSIIFISLQVISHVLDSGTITTMNFSGLLIMKCVLYYCYLREIIFTGFVLQSKHPSSLRSWVLTSDS